MCEQYEVDAIGYRYKGGGSLSLFVSDSSRMPDIDRHRGEEVVTEVLLQTKVLEGVGNVLEGKES